MPLSFRDMRVRVDPESRDSGFVRSLSSGRASRGPVGTSRNDDQWIAQHSMTPTDIEKIFRDEAGRALATLIRLVGDFDLAEDALQDAFAVALERWPAADLPSNPRARLVNVGRNKAIHRVRRQATVRDKQAVLA